MTTAVKLKRQMDMTEGRLFGKVIRYVLPLIATNLLMVCYNFADMVVVGLSTEADAVGAVGVTGAFVTLMINLLIGVGVGVNVCVAQNLGAKNKEGVEKTIHTATIAILVLGFFFGILGILISRPVLSLMGNRGNLLELATVYTKIYFAGTPFIALTNSGVAIFRAKGDTKTPLIVMTSTGIANVILNLFFVMIVGWSVEGVALATLISNALTAVILYYILTREQGDCNFSLRKLKVDLETLRNVLKVGIPSGIQGALFSISNMIIASSVIKVNNLTVSADAAYQPVVKGNSAASSLESFVYNATNAVYQAAVAFTGQNHGAKKYDRIKRVMVCCYSVTFLTAVLVGGLILLFKAPLLSLFGVVDGAIGSLEHVAYDTAVKKLYILIIPYFTLAFMEVGSGILRGMGRSTLSTVICLVGSCVLRIIWVYTIFASFMNLEVLFASYPTSWTLTAITSFIFANIVIKSDKNTIN